MGLDLESSHLCTCASLVELRGCCTPKYSVLYGMLFRLVSHNNPQTDQLRCRTRRSDTRAVCRDLSDMALTDDDIDDIKACLLKLKDDGEEIREL